MAEYIESLERLSEQFARLEGVGKKSAMRMAFSVLELEADEVAGFAQALLDAKEKIHLCPICQNLTDKEKCPICHFCPQPLGICIFIWLLIIIIVIVIIVVIICVAKKKDKKKDQDNK